MFALLLLGLCSSGSIPCLISSCASFLNFFAYIVKPQDNYQNLLMPLFWYRGRVQLECICFD